MLFFALKKNSINDATIKSPKFVSSQRSLTVFLEAEKICLTISKHSLLFHFFLILDVLQHYFNSGQI